MSSLTASRRRQMVYRHTCPSCESHYIFNQALRAGRSRATCPTCGTDHLIQPKARTTLHDAADTGRPQAVLQLLEAGANPTQTLEGEKPFHRAVRRECPETVRILLENGAPPDIFSSGKWTPLHWAVQRRHPKLARLLLRAGADPTTRISSGAFREHTPLHQAAAVGTPSVAEELLAAGADPNATLKRQHAGCTPLHAAVARGNETVIAHLLDAGADPRETDRRGRTPLMMAAGAVQKRLVVWMRHRGGGPSDPDLEPEEARALAGDRHEGVRQAVASCSSPPETLLALMVRAGSCPDLSGLTTNSPDPITDDQRERLQKCGPYGKKLVASHPGTRPALLLELIEDVPRAFLKNPVRDALAMEEPGWRQGLSVRATAALLAQPAVPECWLYEGTELDSIRVRKAVAGNEAAPEEVLVSLSEQSGRRASKVRAAVAGNPNATPSVLAKLREDPEQEVRRSVALNPESPEDVWSSS